MHMPSYPVYCYTKGCKNLAVYKIAGRWSDGVVGELKTYGLCCETCLPAWFQRGRKQQRICRLTTGETLEPPGIFLLARGHRDQTLERLTDLETQHAEEPGTV